METSAFAAPLHRSPSTATAGPAAAARRSGADPYNRAAPPRRAAPPGQISPPRGQRPASTALGRATAPPLAAGSRRAGSAPGFSAAFSAQNENRPRSGRYPSKPPGAGLARRLTAGTSLPPRPGPRLAAVAKPRRIFLGGRQPYPLGSQGCLRRPPSLRGNPLVRAGGGTKETLLLGEGVGPPALARPRPGPAPGGGGGRARGAAAALWAAHHGTAGLGAPPPRGVGSYTTCLRSSSKKAAMATALRSRDDAHKLAQARG